MSLIFMIFFVGNVHCQEKSIVMSLEGTKKLRGDNRLAVKITFHNKSKDTIRFYHPGILYSAFGGYYVKTGKLFSLGILQNDTVIYWEGNCNMERPRQRIYISFLDGFSLLIPKRIEKQRNRIFEVSPEKSVSLKTLVVLTDCYQFESGLKYTLAITYNHPSDSSDNLPVSPKMGICNFFYSTSAGMEFVYSGRLDSK